MGIGPFTLFLEPKTVLNYSILIENWGRVSLTDQETAIERIFCLSQFSRGVACCVTKTTQEALGWPRGRGWQRNCGHEPFLWFLWEWVGEAGSGVLRLASLSDFSRLWRIETTPRWLIPGPRVNGAGTQWPGVEEHDTRGGWGCGLCVFKSVFEKHNTRMRTHLAGWLGRVQQQGRQEVKVGWLKHSIGLSITMLVHTYMCRRDVKA